MIAETGHFALVLALAAALAQTAFARSPAAATRAAYIQFALLALAFLVLAAAFLRSDFSLALAAAHSHSTKPIAYKLSALWGNHEGSMLLWCLFLAACSALFARFPRQTPPPLKAAALGVQGVLSSAFLLFLLLTSNPFARLDPAPFQGLGLNPILQDPALALHPPILYAGYVGFSLAFSFAAAALLYPKYAAQWAQHARIWIQSAWIMLTCGIALGAWWAYRELGWGGFWFWDPVENAALMPWLAGTALLHAAAAAENRKTAQLWVIFLALAAFSLSMLGTFLTRSGILLSVHSFASDPSRGAFILLILTLICGSAFLLFALRAHRFAASPPAALVSREGAILINSLLVSAAAAIVLTGTLYPIALDLLGLGRVTVGPPYFNATFLPLLAPLLILAPAAPFLAWRRGNLAAALRHLRLAGLAALLAAAATLLFAAPRLLVAAFGIGVAVWLASGALALIRARPNISNAGIATAHAGLGILVAGITGVSLWQTERLALLAPGDSLEIAGYQITLDSLTPAQGPDFRAVQADLSVRRGGELAARLAPQKRLYIARASPTREAAIHTTLLPPADLYAVLGDEDQQSNGAWTFTFYHNPLAPLLWLGAALMAAGGALAAAARLRRLRRLAPALSLLIFLIPAAAAAREAQLSPAQEARAQNLVNALHCLVCQGQPLAQSQAPLAQDLRSLIRQKIADGLTDQQLKDFVVRRYGPEILLSPPLEARTAPLWAAPALFLLLALAGAFALLRPARPPQPKTKND